MESRNIRLGQISLLVCSLFTIATVIAFAKSRNQTSTGLAASGVCLIVLLWLYFDIRHPKTEWLAKLRGPIVNHLLARPIPLWIGICFVIVTGACFGHLATNGSQVVIVPDGDYTVTLLFADKVEFPVPQEISRLSPMKTRLRVGQYRCKAQSAGYSDRDFDLFVSRSFPFYSKATNFEVSLVEKPVVVDSWTKEDDSGIAVLGFRFRNVRDDFAIPRIKLQFKKLSAERKLSEQPSDVVHAPFYDVAIPADFFDASQPSLILEDVDLKHDPDEPYARLDIKLWWKRTDREVRVKIEPTFYNKNMSVADFSSGNSELTLRNSRLVQPRLGNQITVTLGDQR